ncbi:MAG: FAD-binding protein [Planctomycetota bacterium]|jgi:succinate dehydrogenase/fumarate reductase flavoprotein subunit
MGYTPEMLEMIKKVEATRAERVEKKARGEEFAAMGLDERNELKKKFHPDYKSDALRAVKLGPNIGENMVNKFVDVLETKCSLELDKVDLNKVDYETDVLVIGGGGAGCAASIMAANQGVNVMLMTKLRLGDANTMMAEGGIQAAVRSKDSPRTHFLDTIGGGHFKNSPELVKALVMDAPIVIEWLESLGGMFTKNKKGVMMTIHGGGTSKKRMHSAADMSGAEIMRTLRDAARGKENVSVIEFEPAVELILDDRGQCFGAVVKNLETGQYKVVRAKATIVSTGGSGRLHYQDFDTTNHYGATGDGLVMAYHAGCKLCFMHTVQYHPTGVVYPEQNIGLLITEKVRGLGAQPINVDGEQFVFPKEPRDIESSAFIRECHERKKGIPTPTGRVGIWLDSPMIDMLHGDGTVRRELPAKFRQFKNHGIDISKLPMLVYPTLHYQNGGAEIDDEARSRQVPNLFFAGEVAGGIHGENRLMGNSLLDINVFGRRAGTNAAKAAGKTELGSPSLRHVEEYNAEIAKHGLEERVAAPILLPDYVGQIR